MAEELTHNQKIGTGFNKNQLRSDRKNERTKTARASELEINLIQDSNKNYQANIWSGMVISPDINREE